MNRKRIARVVAVLGVALVGAHLVSTLPREVEIRYDLGGDHRRATEIHLSYLVEGDEMKGVRFHYAHGAPKVVRHRLDLAPGAYRVVASLHGPDLSRTLQRDLEVPAEGVIRIDLDPK
jgi:hypothetical protein